MSKQYASSFTTTGKAKSNIILKNYTSSSSRCICALFLLNSLTSFSSDCMSLT